MNNDMIFELVQRNYILVITICVMAVAALFFLLCVISAKTAGLYRRYNKLMKNSSGDSIENLIVRYTEKIDSLEKKNTVLGKRIGRLEAGHRGCVQKIGLVRYNAYQDTGCDLSFSLALLDHDDHGVVMSSLYARDGSVIYAKPLQKGKSQYTLSKEEEEAIKMAVRQGESK